MAEPATICEALQLAADSEGAGLRMLHRGGDAEFYTWSSVLERAHEVAGGLVAAGLEPGDLSALVHPTGIDFFSSFFGILLAGGVPVPLYPPVRLGRMAEYHARTGAMLRVTRSRFVLAHPRVRRLLGKTVAAVVAEGGRAPRCLTLDELPAGPAPDLPRDGRALGLVQFSSGTTGNPRPVALTHRSLLAQASIIGSYVRPASTGLPNGVSWLPLYHDMGLVGCVLPALTLPGLLTLLGPEQFVTEPASWLRAISRWGGSVSTAPNFAYALCTARIRDEELEGVDLSGWRLALCGAEPVVPDVLRRFADRFAPWGFRWEALKPVYGLAEAALAVTLTPSEEPMSTLRLDREALSRDEVLPAPDGLELARLGPPANGFEIRIVDGAGAMLPLDRVGRILVKGPSMLREYLNQPEETSTIMVDGWLDTGDRGFVHGGQLVVTGRDKDLLMLRGRKYPPHLVEHVVDGLPGVRRGCVVAASWLPDGAEAEMLLLLVEVAKEAGSEELAALPEACSRAVLAATGIALDDVVLLPPGTLPRTSSGKIRRREALAAWQRGGLSAPDVVTPLTVAGWYVSSAWAFARHKPA